MSRILGARSVRYNPYIGELYTWSYKRKDDQFLDRMLNRVFFNCYWFDCLSHTGVGFIFPGVSDYAAAYMSFHNVISYGPKPFKFFDFWTEHPLFLAPESKQQLRE